MKKTLAAVLSLLMVLSVFTGCSKLGTNTEPDSTEKNNISTDNTTSGNETGNNDHSGTATTPGAVTDLGDDSKTFGDSLDDLKAYAGYFEEETADIAVECVSGTNGCYTLSGNTLTFTSISEDSVYSVSGKLKGNIVIDVGDDHKFDLELHGLSLVSNTANPILVLSGDEVSITAKSEYQNYIIDTITEFVIPSPPKNAHPASRIC